MSAKRNLAPMPSSIGRGRWSSPELMRVVLTVEEAAHKLSVGRTTVYELMRRGELRYIFVGRVRRVPIEAISEFVVNAANAANARRASAV